MISLTKKDRVVIIMLVVLTCLVATFFTKPFAQNQNFHFFADERTLFNVPNFFNVVSNIPFFVVGLTGIIMCVKTKSNGFQHPLFESYLTFFLGIFLTSLGSTWYHLNPSNSTLVWDRLSMSVSFMAFLSIILGTFISKEVAARWLIPLIFAGASSVLYWYASEVLGSGDLRFFMFVQFMPMILVPVIIGFYYKQVKNSGFFLILVLIYGLAKIFEMLDYPIYNAFNFSGHSIKHIVAACTAILLLARFKKGRTSKSQQYSS